MPNAENIDKVIAAIRAEQVAGRSMVFNMGHWWSPNRPFSEPGCGTAAATSGTTTRSAGITPDVASNLFYPHHVYRAFAATPEQGIAVLERLKMSGQEEWRAVMSEEVDDAQR